MFAVAALLHSQELTQNFPLNLWNSISIYSQVSAYILNLLRSQLFRLPRSEVPKIGTVLSYSGLLFQVRAHRLRATLGSSERACRHAIVLARVWARGLCRP